MPVFEYKPLTVRLPVNAAGSGVALGPAGPAMPGPVGAPELQSLPPARPFQPDPRLFRNATVDTPQVFSSRAGNVFESVGSAAKQRVNDIARDMRRPFGELIERGTRPAFSRAGQPLNAAARALVMRTANNSMMAFMGRMMPVVGAGQLGYEAGTAIYNRYPTQIGNGVDAIVNALMRKNK